MKNNKERVITIIPLVVLIIAIGLLVFVKIVEDKKNKSDSTQTEYSENTDASDGKSASDDNGKSEDESDDGDTQKEVAQAVSVEYKKRDIDDSTQGESVIFSEDGVKTSSNGVTVDGTNITITKEGNYVLSGKCTDGSILITTDENADVHIIFNGLELTCNDGPVISETTGVKVVYTIAKDTTNTLCCNAELENDDSSDDSSTDESVTDESVTDESESDGSTSDDSTSDACIYGKGSITFNGSGTLNIKSTDCNAVKSKDNIKIVNGTINADAGNNAIVGKDSVAIKAGTLTIKAGKDGIKSDKEDNEKGYVVIEGGNINITAEDDGIVGYSLVQFDGGNITINAKDKGVNCDGTVLYDATDLKVEKSEEGIQGCYIIINGGVIDITASDDGLNATAGGGSEFSGGNFGGGNFEGGNFEGGNFNPGNFDKNDFDKSGGDKENFNKENFNKEDFNKEDVDSENFDKDNILKRDFNQGDADESNFEKGDMPKRDFNQGDVDKGNFALGSSIDSYCYIEINGGTVNINASGDGLDSNGDIYINGGEVYVDGPVNNGNGALDCGDNNNSIVMNGGVLLAIGSSGMAEFPSSDSKVYTLAMTPDSQKSGTVITIKDSNGNEIFSYTAKKSFASICFASEKLEKDQKYTIYLDGEEYTTITIDDIVSSDGKTSTEGGFGRGGFNGGGFPERTERAFEGEEANE